MSENFLMKSDAEKLLKVSNDQLREWILAGKINVAMQVDKTQYFDVSELMAFMETPEWTPEPAPVEPQPKTPVVHRTPFVVECDVMQKMPDGIYMMTTRYVEVNATSRAQAMVFAEGTRFPYQIFIEPKRSRNA